MGASADRSRDLSPIALRHRRRGPVEIEGGGWSDAPVPAGCLRRRKSGAGLFL